MSVRKEEAMQILYDIFDIPTSQEFTERTSRITRKWKYTEKLEVLTRNERNTKRSVRWQTCQKS